MEGFRGGIRWHLRKAGNLTSWFHLWAAVAHVHRMMAPELYLTLPHHRPGNRMEVSQKTWGWPSKQRVEMVRLVVTGQAWPGRRENLWLSQVKGKEPSTLSLPTTTRVEKRRPTQDEGAQIRPSGAPRRWSFPTQEQKQWVSRAWAHEWNPNPSPPKGRLCCQTRVEDPPTASVEGVWGGRRFKRLQRPAESITICGPLASNCLMLALLKYKKV